MLTMRWRPPLSQALESETPYLLIEGAVRSAKTTCGLWKIYNACIAHPGIHCWIARWTDDDTKTLLNPLWIAVLEQAGVTFQWRPDEHAYYLPQTDALIYLHGIRPSENAARYAKLRGKTLAKILVDQAEELPQDYFRELQGRLSQKDHPHQIILTPNAVSRSHWIAQEWPAEGRFADHEYIRVRVYDNRENVGDDYIRQLERAYPADDPKRRTMLEGLRGLNVVGKAVYAGYFDRRRHLVPMTMNPQLPLLEGLDFGFHHPAVVWAQMTPFGGIDLLGGLQGQDLSLAEFADIVLSYRARWFPDALDIQTCCDPAGAINNAGGQTAVQFLNTLGLYPRVNEKANLPPLRVACIEALKDTMRKRTPFGEAFRVDPSRWLLVSREEVLPQAVLIEALEGGYVWDPHPKLSGHKPLMTPLKDGEYDHSMNCLEYLQVQFGRVHPTEKDLERQADSAYRHAVQRAQRDMDEYDRLKSPGRLTRGGYR